MACRDIRLRSEIELTQAAVPAPLAQQVADRAAHVGNRGFHGCILEILTRLAHASVGMVTHAPAIQAITGTLSRNP